jgi:hypothetical protein
MQTVKKLCKRRVNSSVAPLFSERALFRGQEEVELL